jgi:hypothetical protein
MAEDTAQGALTPAQLEQRGAANLRHGARSEPQVRQVATVQKRRLLRQIGLRAADLDGVALGYLDAWARAQSKVELMDQWAAEHGWLDEDGRPPGFVSVYFAALNSARLSLGKLEEHLKARGGPPSMVAVLQGKARRVA